MTVFEREGLRVVISDRRYRFEKKVGEDFELIHDGTLPVPFLNGSLGVFVNLFDIEDGPELRGFLTAN
jgi:hypothetical protein